MKKVLIVLGLLVLAGAYYGYREFNRKNKDLSKENAQVTITAAEFLKAFQTNETEANTKYLDKIVAVSGVVSAVNKEANVTKITLDTGDPMSSIICEMDSSFAAKAMALQKGKSVIIKGVCSGALGDVVCTRCVIQ